MATRRNISGYFADDKDIADLLDYARRRLPLKRLIEIARRSRRILLSGEDGREAIVERLATLPWSYPQLQALFLLTDTSDRIERKTATPVVSSASEQDIRKAAKKLKKSRGQATGEQIQVRAKPNGDTEIVVQYSEVDRSKTRMIQRVDKEAIIEIGRDDDGWVLGHPANKRAQAIVENLLDLVGETSKTDDVQTHPIELTAITDPHRRTQFFIELLKRVDGFRLNDVKHVAVHQFGEDEEEDDDDDDDDDDSGQGKAEKKLAALVHKAALDGAALLQTPEYKQLVGAGFFVNKVRWLADENRADGIRARFEVDFAKPQAGTGFRYRVLEVFERKTNGDMRKSGSRPKVDEERRLQALVIQAARGSLEEVLGAGTKTKKENATGTPNTPKKEPGKKKPVKKKAVKKKAVKKKAGGT